MNKGELIELLYKKHGEDITKKFITEIVDDVFGTVAKTIKKESRFTYPQFGTFTIRERGARMGRNPQTGEALKIKASSTVGFKPAKLFKESLPKPKRKKK